MHTPKALITIVLLLSTATIGRLGNDVADPTVAGNSNNSQTVIMLTLNFVFRTIRLLLY